MFAFPTAFDRRRQRIPARARASNAGYPSAAGRCFLPCSAIASRMSVARTPTGERARDDATDRRSGDQVEPLAHCDAAFNSRQHVGAEQPTIATTRDREDLKARVWTIERPDSATQIDFAHGNETSRCTGRTSAVRGAAKTWWHLLDCVDDDQDFFPSPSRARARCRRQAPLVRFIGRTKR